MKPIFRNTIIYTFVALLFMAACTTLPYKDDVGFLVSAQANSPEFPVSVNGSICKDMDGQPGICSKRIKTTDTLIIHFDPQPFAYDLTVACTSPMSVPGATVGSNQGFDLKLSPGDFSGLKSFVCIGEVFPQDREQPLSAKFEIRIVVSDSNYLGREAMRIEKRGLNSYLVLGEYARDAYVYDKSEWKKYSKKTDIKISDPSKVMAYSSSFMMRYNFYNMGKQAQ